MDKELIGTLSAIQFRALKGANFINLNQAHLGPQGLRVGNWLDHHLMIVRTTPDENNVHNFVTQRVDKQTMQDLRAKNTPRETISSAAQERHGRLALVQPFLPDNSLVLGWRSRQTQEVRDIIYVPDDKNFGEEKTVRIHDNVYTGAVDQGDRLAEWISDHIGMNLRVVKAAGNFERLVSQRYKANRGRLTFQDGYPIHWILSASLRKLCFLAGIDIPAEVFRPNFIVQGGVPEQEHLYQRIAILNNTGEQPKPCDRCPVTLNDPLTGLRSGDEPLSTLETYRAWITLDGHLKVIFGENFVPESETEIALGMSIWGLIRRDPPLQLGSLQELAATLKAVKSPR